MNLTQIKAITVVNKGETEFWVKFYPETGEYRLWIGVDAEDVPIDATRYTTGVAGLWTMFDPEQFNPEKDLA